MTEEALSGIGLLIALVLVLLASGVITGVWIGFIAGIAMKVAGWFA